MSTDNIESSDAIITKSSMSIKDNPIPWLGAIGTIATFAVTTSFNWALGIQEKVLSHDSRLKVLEAAHLELRSDIREIKDNVMFIRFGAMPVNQGGATTINGSSGRIR